jgi:hypothetical protein
MHECEEQQAQWLRPKRLAVCKSRQWPRQVNSECKHRPLISHNLQTVLKMSNLNSSRALEHRNITNPRKTPSAFIHQALFLQQANI